MARASKEKETIYAGVETVEALIAEAKKWGVEVWAPEPECPFLFVLDEEQAKKFTRDLRSARMTKNRNLSRSNNPRNR